MGKGWYPPACRGSRRACLTFEVIPAIDVRGGACVRLTQGDFGRESHYSDDPLGVALRWQAAGAPRLHVVDLDGARNGHPVNQAIFATICAEVSIPVEVSGGLRDLLSIEAALAYGAARVQLGSAAVRDPDLVRAALTLAPAAIVVAIDARNGEVRTDGWGQGSGTRAHDLALQMVGLGVPRIMFTDINRDGVLSEPNFTEITNLVDVLPVPLVASGGVASIEHLHRLADLGCEGAVVGKALYEGTIRLEEALDSLARR